MKNPNRLEFCQSFQLQEDVFFSLLRCLNSHVNDPKIGCEGTHDLSVKPATGRFPLTRPSVPATYDWNGNMLWYCCNTCGNKKYHKMMFLGEKMDSLGRFVVVLSTWLKKFPLDVPWPQWKVMGAWKWKLLAKHITWSRNWLSIWTDVRCIYCICICTFYDSVKDSVQDILMFFFILFWGDVERLHHSV